MPGHLWLSTMQATWLMPYVYSVERVHVAGWSRGWTRAIRLWRCARGPLLKRRLMLNP